MSNLHTAEPWLTKRELARKLRVSVRTIDRCHYPARRVGGQNRYLLSEVEAAMVDPDGLPDNVVALRPRMRETAA
jgi:hypothetical protein